MGNLVNFSWAVFIEFFSYNGVIVNISRIKNGTFPRFRPRFDGTFPRFDGTFPRFKSRFWLLARICRRVKRKKYLKKEEKLEIFQSQGPPSGAKARPCGAARCADRCALAGAALPPARFARFPRRGKRSRIATDIPRRRGMLPPARSSA
jgi:hypothetical protein